MNWISRILRHGTPNELRLIARVALSLRLALSTTYLTHYRHCYAPLMHANAHKALPFKLPEVRCLDNNVLVYLLRRTTSERRIGLEASIELVRTREAYLAFNNFRQNPAAIAGLGKVSVS